MTTVNDVGPNSKWNSLISNGQKDVVGLLIVPTISDKSNGIIAGDADLTQGISTNLSPFVGEMVTPLSITNIKVMVGSENIIPDQLNYTYDNFLHHFQDFSGKINGNNTLGLNSGLLDAEKWENYYRYYYFNLSRKLEEESMPKSINIEAYNNSGVTASYVIYLISKKSFMVNVSTGRVNV